MSKTTILDDKTQKAIADVYDGSLAEKINKNMRYVATGIIFGSMIGIGIASLTGKCRICFGFWGALAGGTTGYITAK